MPPSMFNVLFMTAIDFNSRVRNMWPNGQSYPVDDAEAIEEFFTDSDRDFYSITPCDIPT